MYHILIFLVALIVLYFIYRRYNKPSVTQTLVISSRPLIEPEEEPDIIYINEPADIEYYVRESTLPQPIEQPIETPITLEIQADSQNVHDSYVVRQTRDLYAKRRISTVISGESLIEWIRRNRLADVLDQIRQRNAQVMSLHNETEMDVLMNVYDYCKGNDDYLNELAYQIKECLNEDGLIYCPTGVVTRLLSTKTLLEPEKGLKTRDMIRQELMNVVSKRIEETDTRESIMDKLQEDYRGIYDRNQIEALVADWIDHVV